IPAMLSGTEARGTSRWAETSSTLIIGSSAEGVWVSFEPRRCAHSTEPPRHARRKVRADRGSSGEGGPGVQGGRKRGQLAVWDQIRYREFRWNSRCLTVGLTGFEPATPCRSRAPYEPARWVPRTAEFPPMVGMISSGQFRQYSTACNES